MGEMHFSNICKTSQSFMHELLWSKKLAKKFLWVTTQYFSLLYNRLEDQKQTENWEEKT